MKSKAIVLKDIDNYQLEYVDKPKCPDKSILVKVKYCGICGSDLRILKYGHKNVRFPAIIGHEISGTVSETGKLYEGCFKPSDKIAIGPLVYCGMCEFCLGGKFEYCINRREIAQQWPGGFCQYLALPAEALVFGNVRKLPDGIDPLHAVLAEPLSSCINAQEQLNININDVVLIIGAGPVGCLHLQLAKARGSKKIILADINQKRLDLAKIFSPDVLLNTSNISLVHHAREATNGMGPDVIITANPSGITQVQAIECAKIGGRIAFFGGIKDKENKPQIDTNLIHYNALKVFGIFGFSPKHYMNSLDLINSGRIAAEQFITKVVSIDDFKKAVKLALNGEVLKIVIKF